MGLGHLCVGTTVTVLMDVVGLMGGKLQEVFKSLPRPKQTKNMLPNGMDNGFNSSEIQVCKTTGRCQ